MPAQVPVLTIREVEIVRMLSLGYTADRIGRATGISPRTVQKHLQNAYSKLGYHDRLLAVRQAAALGLIDA